MDQHRNFVLHRLPNAESTGESAPQVSASGDSDLHQGLFITLEGIEGAGKSTFLNSLKAYFEAQGREVLCLREPGGTNLGDDIRDMVLTKRGEKIHPRSELLLFCASRAQLVETRVNPALKRGAIVICDRFMDSTFAYQGHGRGLSLDLLRTCNAAATGGLEPHITFLIDLPVSVGLSRAKSRQGDDAADRFEAEGKEFHQRIRDGFLNLARQSGHRFIQLDGTLTAPALAQSGISSLKQRLNTP